MELVIDENRWNVSPQFYKLHHNMWLPFPFRNIAFFAGAILAVLVILVVYDEDVLTVEHVLTTTTLLGELRLFQIFCPLRKFQAFFIFC